MLTLLLSSDRKKSSPRVLLRLSPAPDETHVRIARGVGRYIASHALHWAIQLDLGEHPVRPEEWDGIIIEQKTELILGGPPVTRVPTVHIGIAEANPGVACVRKDELAAGRLAAEHLLDRGLVHFAFCGVANNRASRERRRGFLQVLQARGRHCRLLDLPADYLSTAESREKARASVVTWLRTSPNPLGVMGCDDERGVEIIHAAEEAGLGVPEVIAVIGVGDCEMRCELTNPPLSSVATDDLELGRRAAEALHRLLTGHSAVPSADVPPSGVVSRTSTDISAVADKRIAAALRFIHEHGCEPITIADVCRHAGIARTQLEQKFRTYLSRTPQAEVRRVRLARVRKLLHETDLPLKTIAELSGFEYVEYMSSFCKKAFGVAPGQYRRQLRAKGEPPAEKVGAKALR